MVAQCARVVVFVACVLSISIAHESHEHDSADAVKAQPTEKEQQKSLHFDDDGKQQPGIKVQSDHGPHDHIHDHHDHVHDHHNHIHDHHDHIHDHHDHAHDHHDHAHDHHDHVHDHHDHVHDHHNHNHDHHDHVHDHHDHIHDHHDHVHDHHDHVHAHDHHDHIHDHHDHVHAHDHHDHIHDHHDHDHHDHNHQHDTIDDVKFRYSRAANQKFKVEQTQTEPEIATIPSEQIDHHADQNEYQHTHEHHGHSHEGCSHGTPADKYKSPQLHKDYSQDWQSLWGYALGSTLLISCAPFFILFLIPLQDNSEKYQPLLRVLLSFASGGLLGDAFLHLIPHATEFQAHQGGSHGHDHGHSHGHSHSHSHAHGEEGHVHDLTVGLSVLGGLFAFLMIEKLVRLCNVGHSHSHSHSHGQEHKEEKKDDSKPTEAKKDHEHDSHSGDIRVAGYLNLVADFTHNFTDGLAIATSYMLGIHTGIVSTVTILFHEVPHEIGDFSILIQSGFSKRRAIFMQLLTACGALTGTMVGLMAHGLGDEYINLYILPFTAGGFIYIATVSVIPELLEETRFVPTFVQVLAMLCGVQLMVVITWYE